MRTWITINKEIFNNNIKLLKEAIAPTKLAIVLKSNAYGHGLTEIGYLADQNENIDLICTAGLSEALALRNNNIKKNILALSFLDDSPEKAIQNNIQCVIYNLQDARDLNEVGKSSQKKAFVHLKVETGMSRLGISPDNILEFIKEIKKLNFVEINGIFTHLCDTSNTDTSFSDNQILEFEKTLEILKKENIAIPFAHVFSSSGLSIPSKNRLSFLRAGALAYGLWKSESHKNRVLKNFPNLVELSPIMEWKTKIIQIKNIKAGSFVGYDKTFQAPTDMKVGIIPIGYTDGFSRSLSNKGCVIVNNQKTKICGIVSMNLTIIDLTNVGEVSVNDEVTMIGKNLDAFSCAQSANIITNELCARINPLIPKIII